MTAKKSPSTPASKSTKLTDAPKSKVSPSNPEVTMKSDITTNTNPAVNSDNSVNSATPANADNLFDNEQAATEATYAIATNEPPKQQRIGKQQRKSDYADFKATFLTPSKLVKRHPVNIEDSVRNVNSSGALNNNNAYNGNNGVRPLWWKTAIE